MSETPPNRLGNFWATLYGVWRWLRGWLLVLKPCRFPLLAVCLGLILAPAIQDLLRALAEQRNSAQTFFFFAGAAIWSFYAWYVARVMLLFRFPGVPGREPRLQRVRTWVPRFIGFAAMLAVARALYAASQGYEASDPQEGMLRTYALWFLGGSFVFLVALSIRRHVFRVIYANLNAARILQGPVAAPLRGVLNPPRSAEEIYGELDVRDLPPVALLLFSLPLCLAIAFFLLFALTLQSSAPLIGAVGILMLSMTGWLAIGSVLDFLGMRLRFPVFLYLFVLVFVFGAWNDDHGVRALSNPRGPTPMRQDLHAALRAWMRRQKTDASGGKGPIPLFLVDAEGGGIRAAYWTAVLLGSIQDRNPCFADQLFSISGVSGGSLGASVFVSLLVEQRARGAAADCGAKNAALPPFGIRDTAQRILGEDFLSPIVAGMLYPDLVQRFLPVAIQGFDRALALEEAWERAWRIHMPGSNRFAEPFDRLWEDAGSWTPALFLNATLVETGQRFIASNVRIEPSGGLSEGDFVGAKDAESFFSPRSLPLSAAVHMSARFTYVSPPGSLIKGGEMYGHVVDGGYFENSGATTTLEILKAIESLPSTDKAWTRVEPIVIHISNSPVDPNARSEASMDLRPIRGGLNTMVTELFAPVATLATTRAQHDARDALVEFVGKSHFLLFGLCNRGVSIPLSWALSSAARARIDEDLVADCRPADPRLGGAVFDNPSNLRRIETALAGLHAPVAAR